MDTQPGTRQTPIPPPRHPLALHTPLWPYFFAFFSYVFYFIFLSYFTLIENVGRRRSAVTHTPHWPHAAQKISCCCCYCCTSSSHSLYTLLAPFCLPCLVNSTFLFFFFGWAWPAWGCESYSMSAVLFYTFFLSFK